MFIFSNPFSLEAPFTIWGVARTVKNPPAMRENWVWSLRWEDPLEQGMGTHSSILAWRIPGTEEPGGPQSMGSQRVGPYWSNLGGTRSWFTMLRVFCSGHMACRIFPNPGPNPCLLHCKCEVLTTGLTGKSQNGLKPHSSSLIRMPNDMRDS